MGTKTKIEWCDHTFSPWRGCQKVSSGCQHCYAEAQSVRNPKVLGEWGPQGKRVVAAESYWRQPLAWDRAAAKAGVRRRVFCGSMCDVFEGREELEAPRRRLAKLVSDTPHLDWLLLTKRPQNAADMIYRMWFEDAEWPKNWWLGASVEDQAAADLRIPALLSVPARVRFLSCEPLLGPVDLTPHLLAPTATGHRWCETVAWVIVGGESGPDARPCRVEWVRDLVRQCREAGVACFVKQLGAVPTSLRFLPAEGWPEHVHYRQDTEATNILRLRDRKAGDPSEWPADLRVREFPGVQS